MPRSKILSILCKRYPSEIAEHVINSFYEVEKNYRLEKWKTSELDAGHFVEATRRLIEYELQKNYTPFSVSLGSFSQTVLSKFESSSGLEEFRIIIPRILYAIFCVRNKRGVGHIASVSPNKLDATFILHSSKWVLGELVRLSSLGSPEESKQLVDQILYRHIDVIWDDGETFMILDKKLKTTDKVLLVLYRQDRLSIEDLRSKIDYKNKSAFKKIIDNLKINKLVSITDDKYCKLSPLGAQTAEQQLLP